MGGSVLPSGGRQARATTRHIPGRGPACSGFAKAVRLTGGKSGIRVRPCGRTDSCTSAGRPAGALHSRAPRAALPASGPQAARLSPTSPGLRTPGIARTPGPWATGLGGQERRRCGAAPSLHSGQRRERAEGRRGGGEGAGGTAGTCLSLEHLGHTSGPRLSQHWWCQAKPGGAAVTLATCLCPRPPHLFPSAGPSPAAPVPPLLSTTSTATPPTDGAAKVFTRGQR